MITSSREMTRKEKEKMQKQTDLLVQLGVDLTALLDAFLLERFGKPLDVYNRGLSSDDEDEAREAREVLEAVKKASREFYAGFATLYHASVSDNCACVSTPFIDDISHSDWLFGDNAFGPYRDQKCANTGQCSCSLASRR